MSALLENNARFLTDYFNIFHCLHFHINAAQRVELVKPFMHVFTNNDGV
jgi:hypothetical protein